MMSQFISIKPDRPLSKPSPSAGKPAIKKIPVEMRKPRFRPQQSHSWYRRLVVRLQNDSQSLRSTVQAAFALLCVWIGVEFFLFMRWGLSGQAATYVQRPPGAEGFLPISSLISLKYWLQTGIVNEIHPAGFFIFIAILVLGVFLKKSFCSWMCPVGTLSESLWMIGSRIFGKNIQLPKWLDYPLRSVKYMLLLFFGYFIMQMDAPALLSFIESPYNRMADVKMYLFFANISSFALWTIIILAALSVVIKNFWCRYLCPYGALLGLSSLLSPLKITRQPSTCIDCELCTFACPSAIKVHKLNRVWSDECTACLKCVEACPVKNTLDVRVSRKSRPVPNWVFGGLVVGVFVAVTGLAMLSGVWQNRITKEEYAHRFQELDSPAYDHFGSRRSSHVPAE